jgi:hypothetical protein
MDTDSPSIFRDDFKNYESYLQKYQEFCKYYGYKVRVFGGWKFFTFLQDYKIWKNQK